MHYPQSGPCGGCQDSCRNFHATWSPTYCVPVPDSSGFSQTSLASVQFRVLSLHRSGCCFFSSLPHRYDAVMVSLSGHRYGNAQVFTNSQIGASNHSSFISPSDGRGFFGRTSRAVFGQLFVRAKGLFACANTVSTFGRDKSAKSSRESSDRLDLYLLRCRWPFRSWCSRVDVATRLGY